MNCDTLENQMPSSLVPSLLSLCGGGRAYFIEQIAASECFHIMRHHNMIMKKGHIDTDTNDIQN